MRIYHDTRWVLLVVLLAGCNSTALLRRAEQAAKDNPVNPQTHYQLGNAYYRNSLDGRTYDKGKLDRALAAYKKAVELDPKLAAAYGKMGLIHRDLGQLAQAIIQLEKALDLNPDLNEERLALAELHYNQGVKAITDMNYRKGMQSLLRATQLNPQLDKAYDNLAIAYYNLAIGDINGGKFEEGIAKLKFALDINPQYKQAKVNLGVAYAQAAAGHCDQGSFDQAIAMFQAALDLKKTRELKRNLAVVYCKKAVTKSMKKESYSEAIALYKQAIKLCPDKNDMLVKNAKNNITAIKQRLQGMDKPLGRHLEDEQHQDHQDQDE